METDCNHRKGMVTAETAETEAPDKANEDINIQADINSDITDGAKPNINSELNIDENKTNSNISDDVQDEAKVKSDETNAKPIINFNGDGQDATYSILEKLQDMDFRVQFIKMLNNINPNVNWAFELKAISEQHKSDLQIIKVLRSRSWIDQDIEPEYDYSDIFRRIHETFNPIIFEHLESQFNSIDLNPNSSKASTMKLAKTTKPKLRIRILDVDMKALPPKLELDMFIWKRCLIDFFTISNIEYEFASPLEFEMIGSIPGPDEQMQEQSNPSQPISIDSSADINIEEAKTNKSLAINKSYKDMSEVDLYRFNFGWESMPSWKVSREDEKRIDFIWNGINPSNAYSSFLRDLMVLVYTIPSDMEE